MNIDTAFPSQTCTKCRQAKGITAFPVGSYERDTLRSHCQECVNIAQIVRRGSEHQKLNIRKLHLKGSFGITLEEYDRLLELQNDVCAICHNPETATRNGVVRRLSVDHDHKTGANRGLLCQRCNVAIGYLRDSTELLWSAICYLQQHQP